ncbi:MAG: DALR domain-containing protein, partial [bacterium]
WGSGRPGWHIECSVMAKKYLGEQIDIHAGGEDLIFPHHENEIAQSECANGKSFAKYWLHNGFINVDNEKMAKSKGNFFTVRDIAKEIPYDVIRFFIISTHYKSPINFSKEALESSRKGLDRIKNCLKNLEYYLDNNTSNLSISREEQEILKGDVDRYKEYFITEMDNDFNTANAITAIFELVRVTNSNINENSSKEFMENLLDIFRELTGILGIIYEVEQPNDLNNGDSDDISEEEIQDLINKRQEAKAEKNYKLADEIRDNLKNQGIILEDTSAGVRWSRG